MRELLTGLLVISIVAGLTLLWPVTIIVVAVIIFVAFFLSGAYALGAVFTLLWDEWKYR